MVRLISLISNDTVGPKAADKVLVACNLILKLMESTG